MVALVREQEVVEVHLVAQADHRAVEVAAALEVLPAEEVVRREAHHQVAQAEAVRRMAPHRAVERKEEAAVVRAARRILRRELIQKENQPTQKQKILRQLTQRLIRKHQPLQQYQRHQQHQEVAEVLAALGSSDQMAS